MNTLRYALSVVLLAFVFVLPTHGVAEMQPGQIRAIQVEGEVFQRPSEDGARTPLGKDMLLSQGAVIETGPNSTTSLLFENGSVITIGADSHFSIEKFLTDPFDAQNVDYRNMRQEPARSETRLKQDKGSLVFSVRKKQEGSSYDIVTPVGTAGIRGTLGVIWQSPGSPQGQTFGIGVQNGLVQWTTPNGQTRNLGAGSSTGISSEGGAVEFTDPPADTPQMMDMASETGREQQQQTPQTPFNNTPTGALSPDVQSKLEQAAAEGNQALLEAVLALVGQANEQDAAAIIAFAAANLGSDPTLVPQLASLGTEVVSWKVQPGDRVETGQVLAIISVGGVQMEYLATADGILLRQLVMENQPSSTDTLALITVNATELLPALVAAAARLNPSAAASMAGAAAAAFPPMANQIALATSLAAPGQAQQIAQQIIASAPGVNPSAVLTSALTGSGLGPDDINMTVQLLMGGQQLSEQRVYDTANQAMSGGANFGNPFATAGAIDTPGNPGGLSNPVSLPTPAPVPTPTPTPTPPIPFPTPPTPYSS